MQALNMPIEMISFLEHLLAPFHWAAMFPVRRNRALLRGNVAPPRTLRETRNRLGHRPLLPRDTNLVDGTSWHGRRGLTILQPVLDPAHFDDMVRWNGSGVNGGARHLLVVETQWWGLATWRGETTRRDVRVFRGIVRLSRRGPPGHRPAHQERHRPLRSLHDGPAALGTKDERVEVNGRVRSIHGSQTLPMVSRARIQSCVGDNGPASCPASSSGDESDLMWVRGSKVCVSKWVVSALFREILARIHVLTVQVTCESCLFTRQMAKE